MVAAFQGPEVPEVASSIVYCNTLTPLATTKMHTINIKELARKLHRKLIQSCYVALQGLCKDYANIISNCSNEHHSLHTLRMQEAGLDLVGKVPVLVSLLIM